MSAESAFVGAILDPARAAPSGLLDGQGKPAGRRFDIYRNNVTVSLIEALETAFPVVAKLVGAERFRILARAFARAHPPASPLMMFYGGPMPVFLAEFDETRALGYLPDVARLELAIRESYHAADATPLDPARLGALSPERLTEARLGLHPALRIVRSLWPIHAIWRFNIEAGAPKPTMAAEDVAVFRPGHDPVPVVLPKGAAAFLDTLGDGTTLGDAVEIAGPDLDLAATLALLLAHSAITELTEAP